MNKISLIIKREYLTRVRKKSFLIMTIVGPLLFAGIMILPALLMMYSGEKKLIVEVVDESYIYDNTFEDSNDYTFLYSHRNIDSVKADLDKELINAIVYIPMPDTTGLAKSGATPQLTTTNYVYSKDGVSMEFTSYIKESMGSKAERMKLLMQGVDPDVVEAAKTRVKTNTVILDDSGNENVDAVGSKSAVGYIAGFVIYFLVLMFGSSVMSGVNEEKQGRVVEVIISSVKPFELMMGKIIGVGLVGVTQFFLWIALSFGLILGFGSFVASETTNKAVVQTQIVNSTGGLSSGNMAVMPDAAATTTIDEQGNQNGFMTEVIDNLSSLNFGVLILSFLFYFLFGYLMYAALFAAIGAAVDSQADLQQFSTPITMPLIIAIVCIAMVIKNPSGIVSMILSFFPLTSPVIMMARIPFGVPIWEIAVSMICLVLGFLLTTWFAAKIYRTGLLMYGKKITWKELIKWVRY